MFDFYRVAACVPRVTVADTEKNVDEMLNKIHEAAGLSPDVIALPELCVTGYTCQDLFFQDTLLRQVNQAILRLLLETKELRSVIIFGAPVLIEQALYNGAFVMKEGRLLGISLKTFLPNENEFYEKRWFSSAEELLTDSVTLREIGLSVAEEDDYEIPVGNHIIYNISDELRFAVEICEDLWAPIPPSAVYALGGAELIVNISASNEIIGKREYRKDLVRMNSASSHCGYLYVSAGCSESTQDLIFSGHTIIAENGKILNQNKQYIDDDYIAIADLDAGKIRSDRKKSSSFRDSMNVFMPDISQKIIQVVSDTGLQSEAGEFIRVKKHPFIPSAKSAREKRCHEIFDMQVGALAKRLEITNAKPVIGVSGGMDSTLALLVAAGALRKLNRPAEDLVAITMPAFGTTGRTYQNSLELIKSLDSEPRIIDIKEACTGHLRDIGHDMEQKDTTYENAQARERTQVLMDVANQVNGLVVGTGDLSELALGWCTYNGDQMSMYGVNGGVPKTLVRWMIETLSDTEDFRESRSVLKDILDTPISPELLPPDENGNIKQKTEDAVGPYELHDFFLYNMLRYGFSPSKIYFMAKKAFKDDYTENEIKKWITMFYRRFFNQQFKRSCMPDGVKIGSVALSPRGDLRMPSDASGRLWLKEIENLQ